MKLKITKNLANSVYTSKFEFTELTTFDEELLEDYAGTTYLDIQSDILKTETIEEEEKVTILLKQPTVMKAFSECMPLERAWSIAQYGDKTEEIATWGTKNLEDRIVALVDELKTKGDTFTSISEVVLTP